jgi:hypothetical protein
MILLTRQTRTRSRQKSIKPFTKTSCNYFSVHRSDMFYMSLLFVGERFNKFLILVIRENFAGPAFDFQLSLPDCVMQAGIVARPADASRTGVTPSLHTIVDHFLPLNAANQGFVG